MGKAENEGCVQITVRPEAETGLSSEFAGLLTDTELQLYNRYLKFQNKRIESEKEYDINPTTVNYKKLRKNCLDERRCKKRFYRWVDQDVVETIEGENIDREILNKSYYVEVPENFNYKKLAQKETLDFYETIEDFPLIEMQKATLARLELKLKEAKSVKTNEFNRESMKSKIRYLEERIKNTKNRIERWSKRNS